jgi:hypothetical protein
VTPVAPAFEVEAESVTEEIPVEIVNVPVDTGAVSDDVETESV